MFRGGPAGVRSQVRTPAEPPGTSIKPEPQLTNTEYSRLAAIVDVALLAVKETSANWLGAGSPSTCWLGYLIDYDLSMARASCDS